MERRSARGKAEALADVTNTVQGPGTPGTDNAATVTRSQTQKPAAILRTFTRRHGASQVHSGSPGSMRCRPRSYLVEYTQDISCVYYRVQPGT